MPIWEIRYSTPRHFGQLQCWNVDKPSREFAAQKLRDHLFPDGFLAADTPSGITDVTVWQLELKGIRIRDIVQLVALPADSVGGGARYSR